MKLLHIIDALKDINWILAIQEELNQFLQKDVWCLIPISNNMNVIGTKWAFRNKMDKAVNIIRRKG